MILCGENISNFGPSPPCPHASSSLSLLFLPQAQRWRLVNHPHVGPRGARAGCALAALALLALVEISGDLLSLRAGGPAHRLTFPAIPAPPSGRSGGRPLQRFLAWELRCAHPALCSPPGWRRPLLLAPAVLASSAPLLGAPSRRAALPPTLRGAGWHPESRGAASWRLRLRLWGAAAPSAPPPQIRLTRVSPHLPVEGKTKGEDASDRLCLLLI